MFRNKIKTGKFSGSYADTKNSQTTDAFSDIGQQEERERRYGGNFATVYEIDAQTYGYPSTTKTGIHNSGFTFETDYGRSPPPNPPSNPAVNPSVSVDIPNKPDVTADYDQTEPEVIDTWIEFTQTTTFHGIRYIFGAKNIRLRKYLWILCVAVAVGLFMYQVIDRANDYFSFRSNVNVEVIYKKEVIFPSVTLCNQNNYRLTKTVEKDMYSFIDGVYSGKTYTVENQTDVKETDLLDFITQVAHQKEDLIDSCSWKGKPCDVEADFNTTLTDFGVCYTFNSGSNNDTLFISQSGAGFALSLVLNVEQYEYMKGPHDEAGMKVLLHDPMETPLVQDLGFAVAPGTHTLIAVQREEILSLTHPYGTCIEDAQPRSQCVAVCRAEAVVQECGCKDAYMPNTLLTNGSMATVCPVLDAFTCLKTQKDELVLKDNTCTCDIPCYRVAYRPELSYAHLSRLSVDRIWESDPNKRVTLSKKYSSARETFHRVNVEISRADKERYDNILSLSASFLSALELSSRLFYDRSTLLSTIGSPQPPVSAYSSLDTDLQKMTETRDALWALRLQKVDYPSFQHLDKYAEYINDYFISANGGSFNVYYKVLECANLQFVQNVSNETLKTKCDLTGPLLNSAIAESDPSRDINAPYCYPTLRRYLNELNTTMSNYEKIISDLYRKSPVWENMQSHPDHVACQEVLSNYTETWMTELEEHLDLFNTFFTTSSFKERLDIMTHIWGFLNFTQRDNGDVIRMPDTLKICKWYQVPENQVDEAYNKFSQYKTATKSALLESETLLQNLVNEGRSISATYSTTSNTFLLQPIREFLDNQRTKIELYTQFRSDEFRDWLSSLSIRYNKYQTDTNSLTARLSDIESNLIQALHYAAKASVWIVTDEMISQFTYLQYIRDNYLSDEYLQSSTENLLYSNRSLVDDITRYIYSNYRTTLLGQISETSGRLTKLDDAVTAATSNLQQFQEGNALDEDFFMENYIKIDIFYKELSYDRISQQQAFGFISFLSEVGGFLGLLLGASVLTVCELVDYLTLSSLRKCRVEQNQVR